MTLYFLYQQTVIDSLLAMIPIHLVCELRHRLVTYKDCSKTLFRNICSCYWFDIRIL